jgi:hypothetical protein
MCPGHVCRHQPSLRSSGVLRRFRTRYDVFVGGFKTDEYPASNGGSDKCGGIQVDSLITAATRALAAGDPLGALNRVALRDDAPALSLRGIAMAQLGNLVRARRSRDVRRAPSVRKRSWPARGVSSPRPRSRSSRATWTVRRRRSTQASKALVVDACRHVVRDAAMVVWFARRPALFALARAG